MTDKIENQVDFAANLSEQCRIELQRLTAKVSDVRNAATRTQNAIHAIEQTADLLKQVTAVFNALSQQIREMGIQLSDIQRQSSDFSTSYVDLLSNHERQLASDCTSIITSCKDLQQQHDVRNEHLLTLNQAISDATSSFSSLSSGALTETELTFVNVMTQIKKDSERLMQGKIESLSDLTDQKAFSKQFVDKLLASCDEYLSQTKNDWSLVTKQIVSTLENTQDVVSSQFSNGPIATLHQISISINNTQTGITDQLGSSYTTIETGLDEIVSHMQVVGEVVKEIQPILEAIDQI